MANIGDNIKKIRKDRNMTQKDFASKIGVSRSYLGDLENNRKSPSADTITKLSKNIGVSQEYLFNGEDTKINKPTKSIRKHITDIILDDEFHEQGNPIHDSALEDTIQCFEDCKLELKEINVAEIYLANINYYEDYSPMRINDKKSYIKYLKIKISAFEAESKKQGENSNLIYVYSIQIRMDQTTLKLLQTSQ